MTDGWTRLTFPRFVNPALMSTLRSRTEHGTVREDGRVAVHGEDGEPRNVDGKVLEQVGEDPVEPGTEVVIHLRDGDLYCRSLSEQKRVEREVKEHHELKRKARERLKDWKHRRAREFWNQYRIPFTWDVAIKGRLSGLSREAGGFRNGRAANTVEHLYVADAFSEGRLSRDSERYLCDPDSAAPPSFEFTGERRQNSDGDEYRPPVTCSRCLDLMERWKVETDGER